VRLPHFDMTKLRHLYMIVGALIFASLTPHYAVAQVDRALADSEVEVNDELPIDLEADEFDFDHETQKVRASGNVVVNYGVVTLTASQIVYDILNDRLEAVGGVTMTDNNNNTFSTDRLLLEDQLSRGQIDNIKITLANEAWMTADKAERQSLERAVLHNAAFSTCKVCADNPRPLWQIRASRIIHDNNAKDIIYRNVYFDFMDVPVMWVPYFRHADPSVERRSGLLLPSFSSTDELGSAVEVPFYWEISPHQDMTITPVFSTKELGMLKLEYRQRFATGDFLTEGAITYVDEIDDTGRETGKKDTRGYVFAYGDWKLGDHQAVGFQAERATDDTFLRRFDFTNRETLLSRIYYDYISQLDHLYVEALSFQGLRIFDDQDETPIIFPTINYHTESDVDAWGGRLFGDFGLLSLYRKEGIDMGRATASVGWRAPYILPLGSRLQVTAKVRMDGYAIHDDPAALPSDSSVETYGRVEPILSLDWRMPFIRTSENFTQIIEPVIFAIAAPYDGTSKDVPNEDSQSFEFDSSNLFRENRFNGLDLMESGPRAAIGLQWTANWNNTNQLSVLLGQNFRPRPLFYLDPATGLRETTSDYVGAIDLALGRNLSFQHRVRLDRSSFSTSRQEVTVYADYDVLKLQLSYLQLDKSLTVAGLSDREEVRADMRVPIYGYWSVRGVVHEDLSSGGGGLRREAALIYEDECFYFEAGVRRKFTRDRDIKPSTAITVRVRLTGITSDDRRSRYQPRY